jgi:hypothetical protein
LIRIRAETTKNHRGGWCVTVPKPQPP